MDGILVMGEWSWNGGVNTPLRTAVQISEKSHMCVREYSSALHMFQASISVFELCTILYNVVSIVHIIKFPWPCSIIVSSILNAHGR